MLKTEPDESKKSKFLKNVHTYFKEYCRYTPMHGFQYFGDPGRSRFERYWWFVVLLASFSTCYYSVYLMFKKWEGSPINISFASKGTPIYTVPFPAVTICPEAKTSRDRFNYTRVLQKKEDGVQLTPEEDKHFEYMSMICDYKEHLNYTGNQTLDEDFYDVIDYLKPDFHIMNCSFFLATSLDCRDIFVPIVTQAGICYTFNIMDRTEFYRESVLTLKNFHAVPQKVVNWTMEGGYTGNTDFNTYPYRAFLSGLSKGLTLNIFTPYKDLDYACKSPLQGYTVMLYSPITLPRPHVKYFILPLDQKVVAAVEPSVMKTSPAVEKYSPKSRGCYFQNERHLKYFKLYTYNSCKMECLTNYTLHLCDCVGFFMPRTNGTPICGPGKIKCMALTEEIMQYANLEVKLEHDLIKFSDDFRKNCDCLPLCSDLTYKAETSQTFLSWTDLSRARRNLRGVDRAHMSSLTVYFTSGTFITSVRDEMFGPLDFLANFGGLIGLFTGVSLITFVEILYFLTIRILCNIRIYRRWTGS